MSCSLHIFDGGTFKLNACRKDNSGSVYSSIARNRGCLHLCQCSAACCCILSRDGLLPMAEGDRCGLNCWLQEWWWRLLWMLHAFVGELSLALSDTCWEGGMLLGGRYAVRRMVRC